MKKLVLIAALFISFVAFANAQGYKLGDKAMSFNLQNVDGKNVSPADYKDAKGFIVVFTCNHCPFAVKYQDRINALNKKYEQLGYPVIAINSDDSTDDFEDSYSNMQVRAKEQSFTFPYLLDASQQIGKAYGATKTPDVFVLQKKGGSMIVKYMGAIDDNIDDPSAVKLKYVELAVDALLSGKEILIHSTKAIGCGIRYKKQA
jgi:peroxiredoxin